MRNIQTRLTIKSSDIGSDMQAVERDSRFDRHMVGIAMLLLGAAPIAASGFDLARLNVNQTGVHEISIDALAAQSIDLSGVEFSRIGMSAAGAPVAIEILDDGNGLADSGDSIRFMGAGTDTLYTDTRVYTLKLDEDILRIPTFSAPIPAGPSAPSYMMTQRYAPQSSYSLTSPSDDPWYAAQLLAYNEIAEHNISLPMDNYVASAGVPELTVKLWGDSDLEGEGNDHHAEVYINNAKVMDEHFDGVVMHDVTKAVSVDSAANEAQIKIRLPGDTGFLLDRVNIDEVSLRYPRRFVADGTILNFRSHWPKYRIGGFESSNINVYAVDDEEVVRRIGNVLSGGNCSAISPSCEAMFAGISGEAQYYAVSENGLIGPSVDLPLPTVNIDLSAEVVVIAHPSFIDLSGQPLEAYVAQLSSENSGGAILVDAEQIYAQYADGEFGATAIQDYIKAAYARGTESVILVGGDVYDYRDFKQMNAISFIPSIYEPTNHIVQYTPADPKYGDVDGDNIPDMVIARLPVRTEAELNAMLSKRNAYLNNTYTNTAVFAADKTSQTDLYDFGQDSDELISNHFGGWDITRAYLDDLSAESANAVVSSAINAGTALAVYSGHSSANQLSFYGLFDGDDAASLTNIGSPTVITQWGCWNTYNVNPETESMSHQFLLSGEQGAVAVLGSSVVSKVGAEKIFANLFYAQLKQGKTLGKAMLLAKQEYAAGNGTDLDILLGVTEMGFPGITIQ